MRAAMVDSHCGVQADRGTPEQRPTIQMKGGQGKADQLAELPDRPHHTHRACTHHESPVRVLNQNQNVNANVASKRASGARIAAAFVSCRHSSVTPCCALSMTYYYYCCCAWQLTIHIPDFAFRRVFRTRPSIAQVARLGNVTDRSATRDCNSQLSLLYPSPFQFARFGSEEKEEMLSARFCTLKDAMLACPPLLSCLSQGPSQPRPRGRLI